MTRIDKNVDNRVPDTDTHVGGNYICHACRGGGQYYRSPWGARTCYRCGGKGYHSRRDRIRNKAYDKHKGAG